MNMNNECLAAYHMQCNALWGQNKDFTCSTLFICN